MRNTLHPALPSGAARGPQTRPTPRGIGLLVLSLLAVVLGAILPERIAVQLGLFGFLLSAVSWPIARANLRNLRLSREAPPRAFAGQLFSLRLTVHNDGRMDSGGVEVEDGIAGPAERGLFAGWLRAGGSISREFQTRVLRRGDQPRIRSVLSSTFPLGLWKSTRELRDSLDIIIHPRPVSPRELQDAQDAALLDAEEDESARRDWAGDFHGIREWQPGDRVKLIHWPSTARSREVMVRQFDRRLPEKFSILFHSIHPGPLHGGGADGFDSAMELVCGLLLHCRDHGIPLDLTASFCQWRTVHVPGPSELPAALDLLARARRTAESDAGALLHALSGIEAGARVFLISDVPTSSWTGLLPDLPFEVTCLSVADLRIKQPMLRVQTAGTAAPQGKR